MSVDSTKDGLKKWLVRYRGFVFRWQTWKQLSPEWNHDHCQGCSARFAERPQEWQGPVLQEGWVTLWRTDSDPVKETELIAKFHEAGSRLVPSPKRRGFQLDWICPTCFEACREELNSMVDPDLPVWEQAGL